MVTAFLYQITLSEIFCFTLCILLKLMEKTRIASLIPFCKYFVIFSEISC